MNLYEEQFDEQKDFPILEKGQQDYIICSTPRCGSHLLGHTLYQTERFGFPLEYFQRDNFNRWKSRFQTRGITDTLTQLRRYRTSPNGVFGCKLHFDHFEYVSRNSDYAEIFPEPKFLLLKRRDLLGQAVSLAKARSSGAWISMQEPVREAKYDRKGIDLALRKISRDNARWEHVLSSHDWPYMQVYYEDFLKDRQGIVQEIADFLSVDIQGVTLEEEAEMPKRQGDNLNRQFREKYLTETRIQPLASEIDFLYGVDRLKFSEAFGYWGRSLVRGIKKLVRNKK